MTTLFIGPLTPSVTDEDLQNFFVINGATVTNAEVKRDRTTGASRKFATADAEDPAGVIASCSGRMLGDRQVIVKDME